MSSKKKLDDNSLEKVTGGLDNNFYVNLGNGKQFETEHNKEWIDMVREAAEKFDSESIHFCVCGTCPGCGATVGIQGDVCKDCREKAKCLK